MRNCEPYTEVSKETLNPHYLLQQGTAPFSDEEYKKVTIQFYAVYTSSVFITFAFATGITLTSRKRTARKRTNTCTKTSSTITSLNTSVR